MVRWSLGGFIPRPAVEKQVALAWPRRCPGGLQALEVVVCGGGIPPPSQPPSRGGTRGRSGPVTRRDAGPARSYRGAPGPQGPCFAAAAAASASRPATAAPPSAPPPPRPPSAPPPCGRSCTCRPASAATRSEPRCAGDGASETAGSSGAGPRALQRSPTLGPSEGWGPQEASTPGTAGGGGRGQSQAGNKEGDGGGAEPSVRWPQLASQLAHCPLHMHKETLPLPAAAA